MEQGSRGAALHLSLSLPLGLVVVWWVRLSCKHSNWQVACQMIGHHSFAEYYSPPRVLPRAIQLGGHGNLSLDLATGWNFDLPELRSLSMTLLARMQIDFLMLSPPCTAFSSLNHMWNYPKMPPQKVREKIDQGMVHISHSVALAKQQIERDRWFALEHPACATSWRTPLLQELTDMPQVRSVVFDQCMFGLRTPSGAKAMRKRTRIATNSPKLVARLSGRLCDRCHDHQRIEGCEGGVRLSTHAQCYPLGLVEELAQAAMEHARSG